jgi:hypothetical protein
LVVVNVHGWLAEGAGGILQVRQFGYACPVERHEALPDNIFVSRFYNWHSGSWKGVYSHGASYKLKPDAPHDALETLSKNLVVPLMEKLLAEGAIHEYEIDTEAIHTEAPSSFWIFYIAANAEGLDKVNAGLSATLKASPLSGPAFASMMDSSAHRDYLVHTNATYK